MCIPKKEKIVYLLGAGAMIDFGGPTTNELTEECKGIVKDSVLKDIFSNEKETPKSISIVIGSEGGFSVKEAERKNSVRIFLLSLRNLLDCRL